MHGDERHPPLYALTLHSTEYSFVLAIARLQTPENQVSGSTLWPLVPVLKYCFLTSPVLSFSSMLERISWLFLSLGGKLFCLELLLAALAERGALRVN